MRQRNSCGHSACEPYACIPTRDVLPDGPMDPNQDRVQSADSGVLPPQNAWFRRGLSFKQAPKGILL